MRTSTFNSHKGEKFSKNLFTQGNFCMPFFFFFFGIQPKCFLVTSVSKIPSITLLQTEPNKTTAQCLLQRVPPACFGRSQGIELVPGHSSEGCMVRRRRIVQYKLAFGLFRGLVFFFLIGFQFCCSGVKQVTSVLKPGSVLTVFLSQAWNCCSMKFTTRFSLRWSLPARSRRPAYIGSCRGGFWAFSWLPLASSDVSSTQAMPCK